MAFFVSLALDSLQAARTGRAMRVATTAWALNKELRDVRIVVCMA